MSVAVFRLDRGEGSDMGGAGDIIGWGARFPSGLCIIDWNLEAFPESERLDNSHTSRYGSFADIEQATKGHVYVTAISDDSGTQVFPDG